MKFLLVIIGFVVLASQGAVSTKATLQELKAFEKFSPYPWTQWLKFHPGSAAAIAIAPSPGQLSISVPDLEDSDEESNEDDDLQTLIKRAILPEVIDTIIDSDKIIKPITDKNGDDVDDDTIVQVDATKKAEKDAAKALKKAQKAAAAALTTKKPSIVDVEPDFWGPPPSLAPNVTSPLPPGYYASKKAMFISKLFAALAESVLNSTGPPTPIEITTTTQSPRQALLEELNNVLLSDTVRSAPAPAPVDDDSESDEEESDESDEDSDEIPIISVVTPAPVPEQTLSPYLTQKLDFLGKLSNAIAAKPSTPKPTKAPSPWAWGKPTKPTKPTKAPKKAKPVKGKKLKGKKGGPEVAVADAPPSPAATTGLDYDALAKALLANGATSSTTYTKSKKV